MSDDRIYEFAGFRIEMGSRQLMRGESCIPLAPKAFDTLLLLVQNAGRIMGKQEFVRAIWPDSAVEENNLNQNISRLRRLLGDTRSEERFIATSPGLGYRFTAAVKVHEAEQRSGGPIRIAVLPFENLGAGAERDYLADGLTEETIAALGQIDTEGISVIGRTTVMHYKRTSLSLAEIGRELQTAYLVESSLRAEGDRLRITAKLVRAADQLQIWCASYDSEPVSMLAFQRELSIAIAEQVRHRLLPSRLSALSRRGTQSAEAYDHYLHGRHFWSQLTAPTTRRAIEDFTRATLLDPGYALAWSGLADCYSSLPIHADFAPLAMLAKAQDAVEHAIAAEPALAEVQTSLGIFKFFLEGDWAGAEAAYRQAITLNPNYPLAHRMLGIMLSHCCRHDEARSSLQRARELDPLYVMHQSLSSQVAFAARDFAAARHYARQALIIDPEFWIAYLHLAQVLVEINDYDGALDALHKAGKLSANNTKILSLRGYIFARSERTEEAKEVLSALQAVATQRYVPPYAEALVRLGLGQHEIALQDLERALQVWDVHLLFPLVDPKWDVCRADPRFMDVMERYTNRHSNGAAVLTKHRA